MYVYRGLAYCNKCGHRGVSKLVGLANPCGQIDTYGRANLDSSNNDKLPPNMKNWPDELVCNAIKPSSTLSNTERSAIRGVEAFIKAEQSNIRRMRHRCNSRNQHNQPITPNIPLAITNTALPAINEESSGSD